MAKLTKRTTEQLQSYLGSLSAAELVEVLLSHAPRDNELRDRLLIESRSGERQPSTSSRSSGRSMPPPRQWL